MNAYIIHMKHAHGVTRIKTTASRVSQAVRQVLNHEGAPFRAVIKVRCLGPVFEEIRHVMPF